MLKQKLNRVLMMCIVLVTIIFFCNCGVVDSLAKGFDQPLYESLQRCNYILVEDGSITNSYNITVVEDDSKQTVTSGLLSSNWHVTVDPDSFDEPSFEASKYGNEYYLTISAFDTKLYR